jgi:hypothetical protein
MRVRGRWAAAAFAGMIVVAASVSQSLGPRPPSLPRGSIASLVIDLDETRGGQGAVKITNTDGSKIESLASVLSRARSAEDHKCSSTGKLIFGMKDGIAAFLGLLPGHDRRYYEFRAPSQDGYNVFKIERQAFLQTMAALGVSTLEPGLPEKAGARP